MNSGGRPATYTEEVVREICGQLDEYVKSNDIPNISRFAGISGVVKQRLYEFAKKYDWFADAMKKCTEKKEAALEELALSGGINVSMAIFSLKQLGWSDKTQTEITGKDGGAIKVEMTFDEKMKLLGMLNGDIPAAIDSGSAEDSDGRPVADADDTDG